MLKIETIYNLIEPEKKKIKIIQLIQLINLISDFYIIMIEKKSKSKSASIVFYN